MSNTTDRKFNKTKFEGVFWRLSAKRDPRTGQQDRVYSFWFSDHDGKGHWKTVGRHSQGVRPQTARLARSKFLAELADTGCNPIERNKVTIGQAVDAFVTWVQSEGRNIKPPYTQYNTHLRDSLHTTPIANVTPSLLSFLKAELLEAKAGSKRPLKHPHRAVPSKKLAPATINNIFNLVRSAVNRAIATNMWQGNNPFSTKGGVWQPVKVNNSRLRFFSPEEAKNLLAELQILEPQVHDMALLSLRTGIRATEIFKLKGQDIDTNANLLHIIGKGGKRVAVKVPPDIIAILAGYGCAHSEPIFKSLFTGKALTKGLSVNNFRSGLS